MDSTIWNDMFQLGLPVLEKIFRPVIVYIFLVVALRLAGKRELAELNPMDLVVLLTLSNTVQNAIIGDDNSVLGGIIGATTLLSLNFLVVRFLYKHRRLERLAEGDKADLIRNGQLIEERLDQESLSRSELEAAARREGLGSLDEVERAVLEPSGRISIIPKKPETGGRLNDEILERLDVISQELAQIRAGR
jgi:uncharacterized membrane protein YcaP (DUF421 family)